MKKEDKRSSTESIEFELGGLKFRLKSKNGEEYVKKVSEYVNRELHKVADKTGPDSMRIALLTAMNIAENYFLEVNNQRTLVNSLLEKTNKLVGYINKRLD